MAVGSFRLPRPLHLFSRTFKAFFFCFLSLLRSFHLLQLNPDNEKNERPHGVRVLIAFNSSRWIPPPTEKKNLNSKNYKNQSPKSRTDIPPRFSNARPITKSNSSQKSTKKNKFLNVFFGLLSLCCYTKSKR
jgi:hypothetical protein